MSRLRIRSSRLPRGAPFRLEDLLALTVYCGCEADGREHWLPQSLGVFGPLQVLHDWICADHNRTFGQTIDEEFIRTGPEGVFRAALGLGLGARRDREPGNPFLYRAAVQQPVRAVQMAPPQDEAGLLWEAAKTASRAVGS